MAKSRQTAHSFLDRFLMGSATLGAVVTTFGTHTVTANEHARDGVLRLLASRIHEAGLWLASKHLGGP